MIDVVNELLMLLLLKFKFELEESDEMVHKFNNAWGEKINCKGTKQSSPHKVFEVCD